VINLSTKSKRAIKHYFRLYSTATQTQKDLSSAAWQKLKPKKYNILKLKPKPKDVNKKQKRYKTVTVPQLKNGNHKKIKI
jgi:hypothetical protein